MQSIGYATNIKFCYLSLSVICFKASHNLLYIIWISKSLLPHIHSYKMDNLVLCEANNVPLTPITFLKRASECYPNRTSIIYGQTRFTWPQTYDRCCRLAASLLSLNITRNDVVRIFILPSDTYIGLFIICLSELLVLTCHNQHMNHMTSLFLSF